MASCSFEHIPERLHTNDKPVINQFQVGEHIYRRCTQELLDTPFNQCNLYELSVNRKGLEGDIISREQDVLINIKENNAPDYDLEICLMEIQELDNNTLTYNKEFESVRNNQPEIARMQLVHDPDPCMYPHCVFRIWLNDVLVTKENYAQTIRKSNMLKNMIRTALGKMIVQRRISQSQT